MVTGDNVAIARVLALKPQALPGCVAELPKVQRRNAERAGAVVVCGLVIADMQHFVRSDLHGLEHPCEKPLSL